MLRILLSAISFCLCSFLFGQAIQSDSTKSGKYIYVGPENIKVEGYFKDSKRHKLWTWYAQDGSKLRQMKYKHGKQLWVIYFENNKASYKITRHGKKRNIKPCSCREVD